MLAYLLVFERGVMVETDDIAVLLTELFLSGILVAVWGRGHRWIRRQTPRVRWALAISACLVPLLSLTLVIVAVR